MLWIVSVRADNFGGLKVGFYSQSCPQAESIISSAVSEAIKRDPKLVGALIRMHFHDCFVRGCDGSILLDSIGANLAEKASPANSPSLHGFQVIDEAKKKLEAACPQVVSCADIVAFAARDSSYEAGQFSWQVQAGRRDGMISNISDTKNLPPSTFNVTQLTASFNSKGLTQEDMVILSGAHSVGVSHCSSFSPRLYNFSNTGAADPSLDPKLVKHLKYECPPTPPVHRTVPMESITPTKLDNLYYSGLLKNRGLFTSDQTLLTNPDTLKVVKISSSDPSVWKEKFAKAMVKMGTIQVLTGSQGQIRKNCRLVNRH
ncbi:peroxidase 5 [Cryptomeria japonica]|uniref:peroxidase 5 n=1 Tax=Cryptomeria japonica TaxID=3369 RepID=UPI0027DA8991|nr:peroxidase 5 [Cryptomeria japonica]